MNVSITLHCPRGSLVWIDGLRMFGGFINVQGSRETPWVVQDVRLWVTNASISAIDGPAVGIEVRTASAAANVTASLSNVSIVASNSVLSSSVLSRQGCGVSSVLGITLCDASVSSTTLPTAVSFFITDVTIAAVS